MATGSRVSQECDYGLCGESVLFRDMAGQEVVTVERFVADGALQQRLSMIMRMPSEEQSQYCDTSSR
jgi:hypothetical protein